MTTATNRRNGHGRATATAPKRVRVAYYTRQSVADDAEFGSIQAQREALEAHVATRKADGWEGLPDEYNDHGCSGATTDRDALQRLMDDVRAGKIDVVVVQRADRISRSLLDFLRLIDFLEKHGVRFVSITQPFETTTAAGRLMMQNLMSFAEFERSMIAERTSDKMRSAKRRGLWCGGFIPLGFDVRDKRLVANTKEADQVRAIFDIFTRSRSLTRTLEELDRRGWTTKSWKNAKGNKVGGRRFTKSTLRGLLSNVLLVGKMRLGDEVFSGQHDAIVDRFTFDAAQHLLQQRERTPSAPKAKWDTLLTGILRCAVCGAAMTHAFSSRASKRYRYYQCTTAQRRGAASCPGSRIAVGDMDAAVVQHIKAIGRNPDLVAATIEATKTGVDERRPDLAAQQKQLDQQRREHEKEQNNLVDAVAAGTSGKAVLDRLQDVESALAEVIRSADEVARELAALDVAVVDEVALRDALAAFDPLWDQLTAAERRRVMHLLVEEIQFDARDGGVEIKFRPDGPSLTTTETNNA